MELTGSGGVGWQVSFNNLPLSVPTSLVLGLYVLGSGELNSDLSAWAVGSLVTEPSPLFLLAALWPCCFDIQRSNGYVQARTEHTTVIQI